MRWPPWKRGNEEDVQGPIDPVDLSDLSREAKSAESAKERASRDLKATRERSIEVTRVTESLTVRLQRNHWAEMMDETFRGNPHG